MVALATTGAGRPTLDGRETPRATDLLRAEKLAEQARKRLELPGKRAVGWKRGGKGWDDGPGAATRKEAGNVVINVRAPKSKRTTATR